MAVAANDSVLSQRSNSPNVTVSPDLFGGDFTTAAPPCVGDDCDDDDKDVPLEAVIFLVTVLVFVFLLIIFFLYLNKSLCFSECGGFPCIDKVPEKDHTLDSETEEDLHEVHTSTPARATSKEAPAIEDTGRKSRSRSRVTAADGGEAHDGNGTAVQDGGKGKRLLEASARPTCRRPRYTQLDDSDTSGDRG